MLQRYGKTVKKHEMTEVSDC